ncbi:AAA family ATPase [Aliivibrio wodanis]|uniref:AAA family ATPase n=1 Tax=Aliivibrio wodanis TaxID=80852 RepID=UPI00406C7108
MDTVQKEVNNQGLVPQVDPPGVAISIKELNIPPAVIENLILKHLAAYPKSDVLHLTHLLGINSHIVEDLLSILRKKSQVEVFQSELSSHSLANAHVRYALSEQGRVFADSAFKKDPYLGPAPVSLEDYRDLVEAQDLRTNTITKTDLTTAFHDVYGANRLIGTLGPAINSGRALLLYGDAGTGKSFIATRLLNALNTSVYIPYAVYANGNIIKVFTKHHHYAINEEESLTCYFKQQYDKRWILCKRPNVQVGGELTMDMLEVNHTEHNRVWMAPLQMMANNGILIIDDLGRQPMPISTLLNRWIVPMEYGFDYLSLPNGQQTTIPFILTLAFSSNLSPQDIGDPAFLRRLGYKVQFSALDKSDYQDLWKWVANSKELSLSEGMYTKLYELHNTSQVEYLPCLPKDIAGICRDIVLFEELEPCINSSILEQAWALYFTDDA